MIDKALFQYGKFLKLYREHTPVSGDAKPEGKDGTARSVRRPKMVEDAGVIAGGGVDTR